VPKLVAEVEEVAEVVACQYPSLRVEVRNVGDVRAQAHLGPGIVRVDLERAEEPAEGQLLLVGDRLPGEDEDSVTVESRLDLGERLGRHRAG
jgi:hypothetical protein